MDMGCWQEDGEGLDSCCWPDTVVLSYSWSSSIHSLTPEAWLVCCRGLRLLLSTMSEHMQLSLALCRIGLYTVRKNAYTLLSVCKRTAGMCCVVCVCAGLNIVSFAMVFIFSWVLKQILTKQQRLPLHCCLVTEWRARSVSFEWVFT